MKPERSYQKIMDFNEIITLYYDSERCQFIDDDGFIVSEIFEVITPNDLFLFRHCKENMFVFHQQSNKICVELVWPIEDDNAPWDERFVDYTCLPELAWSLPGKQY